jgi:hypothetical protein
MNAKQELYAAIEAAEVYAVKRASEDANKEEGRYFATLGRMPTWKEYCSMFDAHLHSELILSKVVF